MSEYGRGYQDIFSLLLFGSGGAFVSVCVAYVVNLSLVEITTSPVASVGFGIIFIFLGGVLLSQVLTSELGDDDFETGRHQGGACHFAFLVAFACAVVTSGLFPA